MAVTGQITHAVSLTRTSTTGTAGSGNEQLNLGQSPVSITDGSGDNQFLKLASGVLTLAISTPQELDLTAITGALGTVAFSTVKFLRIYNRNTTAANKVTVGGAASNAFLPGLGGTTPTYDVHAGGVDTKFRPLGAGWTVDSTHKALKFDPGSAAQVIEYVIAGT
jgi:hypothetical protein